MSDNDSPNTQTPNDENPSTSLEWRVPSRFRDADDLLVIRVVRDSTGAARVVVGTGTLDAIWGDERAEQTAAVLREIADALVPLGTRSMGGGEAGTA